MTIKEKYEREAELEILHAKRALTIFDRGGELQYCTSEETLRSAILALTIASPHVDNLEEVLANDINYCRDRIGYNKMNKQGMTPEELFQVIDTPEFIAEYNKHKQEMNKNIDSLFAQFE